MQLVTVIRRFIVMFIWIATCMSELSVLICFCACADLKTKTNDMRTIVLWGKLPPNVTQTFETKILAKKDERKH